MSLLTMFGKASAEGGGGSPTGMQEKLIVYSSDFDDVAKTLSPTVNPSATETWNPVSASAGFPAYDVGNLNGEPIVRMRGTGAHFGIPSDVEIASESDFLIIFVNRAETTFLNVAFHPFDARDSADGLSNTRFIIQTPPYPGTGFYAKIRYFHSNDSAVEQEIDSGDGGTSGLFHAVRAIHISGSTVNTYIAGTPSLGEYTSFYLANNKLISTDSLWRKLFYISSLAEYLAWGCLAIYTKSTPMTVEEINEKANAIATKYGLTWNDLV